MPPSECFLYTSNLDLDYRLRKITTKDLLLHGQLILKLLVPSDTKENWMSATAKASTLRTVPHDYRISLIKYKNLTIQQYKKRYSYVSVLK